MGCEVFTKLRFGSRSKKFGNRCTTTYMFLHLKKSFTINHGVKQGRMLTVTPTCTIQDLFLSNFITLFPPSLVYCSIQTAREGCLTILISEHDVPHSTGVNLWNIACWCCRPHCPLHYGSQVPLQFIRNGLHWSQHEDQFEQIFCLQFNNPDPAPISIKKTVFPTPENFWTFAK